MKLNCEHLPRTSNVIYTIKSEIVIGKIGNKVQFILDKTGYEKVKNINLYSNCSSNGQIYIINSNGVALHRLLLEDKTGFEIDHKNLDTMDNRYCNLRYCTHQQNQCNQGLQINNTSGYVGVSYYKPRKKYRARIKVFQKELHLGYFNSLLEAVQARNVGMQCLFGQFGCYNNVPEPSEELKASVIERCEFFTEKYSIPFLIGVTV